MIRSLCALVVTGIVSGFAFLLVTGEYSNEGPVLVTVARGHGVHAGDVFVIAGWAVAVLAILALVLLPRRDAGRARGTAAGRAGIGAGRYGRPRGLPD
jgi:hypothetical protein